MNEIRTRCKQGTLIITDQQIRVELGQFRQQTLSRSALTGIDSKMGMISVFGMGGGTNLVFHGQGAERLHADLVKPSVAREIKSALGF
jgi:hypothetical protein